MSEAPTHFIEFVLVPAVLMVRTYAVWKRDNRVGIGLALLFVLCQTAMGVIMEKWVSVANREYCVDSLFSRSTFAYEW